MSALPLSDLADLRRQGRRTLVARLLLAALALALLVLALLSLSQPAPSLAHMAPRSDGVMVIDLSGSTSDSYGQMYADLHALQLSHHGQGHYGVVFFSQFAAEALPPTAPAAELKQIAYYFEHPDLKTYSGGNPAGPEAIRRATNPWGPYSQNTSIDYGLSTAALALVREHVTAPVILVSDLDDNPMSRLVVRNLALSFIHYGLHLEVLSLKGAAAQDITYYRSLPGGVRVVTAQQLAHDQSPEPGAVAATASLGFPLSALLLLGAAFVCLAALVALTVRLDWRPAAADESAASADEASAGSGSSSAQTPSASTLVGGTHA